MKPFSDWFAGGRIHVSHYWKGTSQTSKRRRLNDSCGNGLELDISL